MVTLSSILQLVPACLALIVGLCLPVGSKIAAEEAVSKPASDQNKKSEPSSLPPALSSLSEDLRKLRLPEHPWERYVRGFRREHNFALSLGGSAGSYNVVSFGQIDHQIFQSDGSWAKFQYLSWIRLFIRLIHGVFLRASSAQWRISNGTGHHVPWHVGGADAEFFCHFEAFSSF